MTTLSQTILAPAALAFQAVTNLRAYLYRRQILRTYRSALPVICVGNAIAGGSGKSPVVDFLCEELKARERRPAILLRGYGGTEKGPHHVRKEDSVWAVGDEALMHQAAFGGNVPIVVSARRAEGIKLIEGNCLADIVVLDDGYQHFALERDLNILLLDVTSEAAIEKWRSGNLLPAGYLREPLRQALSRADAVFFVNKNPANQQLKANFQKDVPPSLPQFVIEIQPTFFVDLKSGEKHSLDFFKSKTIGLLSAIASPQSFIETIKMLGMNISQTFLYADHHCFSPDEYRTALAQSAGPVIVTAKDAVKLQSFVQNKDEVFILSTRCQFADDAQGAGFFQLLESKLKRHTA